MSFEALQERLSELQDTASQLKVLIDRLANLKFQTGSLPLSGNDENNAATELGSEISQTLREAEEDLELLQEETADLRGRPGTEAAHNKARLKDGVVRLAQDIKAAHISFRKAQFSAHRSLEEARRLERELFLASFSASALNSPLGRSSTSSPVLPQQRLQELPSSPNGTIPTSSPTQQLFSARDRRRFAQQQQQQLKDRQDGNGGDAAVVGTSSDVTEALRRTQALIAGELARSDFARQTLAESTAALAGLQQTYAGLDGALARSRDLVGALLSSRKSDTWYLQTALYMLLATLAWLVFRRFLYGPLWWLVWLPLRTVWRTGKAVSSIGGGGSGARMEIVGGGRDGEPSTRVVGMEEEGAVPTMQAGEEVGRETQSSGHSDSMLENVGRIVDGPGSNATGEGDNTSLREDAGNNRTAQGATEDQPNPRKRMWEEEKEEAKEAERIKDEL